ncbi:MAG: hypothetical protein GTN80_05215 [Nitrososphaeria archaeon]|nr:hypothetical protein [Nitrososphaeria archaeon]NIQ33025.1 hypothetical protein [Nitrososphaeria archaeon]
MCARKNKQRKEKAQSRRRRGFGDDLFYRMVERHTVRVGDEFSADVLEIDAEGNGVVRIGKLMIQVPDSKIGTKVKLKILEISGRTARAKVLD